MTRILGATAAVCAIVGVHACASSKPPQLKGAEAYYQEGMNAMERGRCLDATEKFQRLVSNFPGSRLVADAQYQLAESYFCSGDYVNAVFEYQRVVDMYPSSEHVDEAQFQIAESYYKQVRRAELDQKETLEALSYFRYFLDDNPTSPLAATARERIADCRDRLGRKVYLAGRLYQRQGHLKAAELTYDDLMRRYPDTVWYYHALMQLGAMAQEQGELEQARVHWAEVARDCSDSELSAEASANLREIAPQGGE